MKTANVNWIKIVRELGNSIMPLGFVIGPQIVVTGYWYTNGDDLIVLGIEAADHSHDAFNSTTVRTRVSAADINKLRELCDGKIKEYRPNGYEGQIVFYRSENGIQTCRYYEYESGNYAVSESEATEIGIFDFQNKVLDYLETVAKHIE